MAVAFPDDRAVPREAVCYRAPASHAETGDFAIVIVNVSAQGLMARTDAVLIAGDRLDITLPVVGRLGAVIRWSLGGRIGCELDHVIGLSEYYRVFAEMLKATPL